jgi:phosphate transport system permease protein
VIRLEARRLVDVTMRMLVAFAALLAIVPLALILGFVVYRGAEGVDLALLTQLPRPVGQVGGGMANAIVGTVVLLGLATVFALPLGIAAAVYLAESPDRGLPGLVRFLADVLTGIPSIVIGIFAYAVVVVPTRRFSALAGGVALAVIMLPIVIRTSEEIIRLVPAALREAALALGVPQWKAVLRIVLPAARTGIVTGVLLAMGRVAGETAPLLFTAFGNQYWSRGVDEPIAALPLQIFAYASSPFEDWHRQAWAGALVLIALVFALDVVARVVTRRRGE